MRKELHLPSILSRITRQHQTRHQTSTVSIQTTNFPCTARRPRYSYLIKWKVKTAQTIFSFSVWNNFINIPEAALTSPWYRSHVNVHIDKLTGLKSVNSVTELRGHSLRYIDEILHPLMVHPPLNVL